MKVEVKFRLSIFFIRGYLFSDSAKRIIFLLLLLASGASSAATHKFLIPFGAEWRYHASTKKPQMQWHEKDFDDSHWQAGIVGIGYGDNDDATILKNMRGEFTDVYIRYVFELNKKPKELYLYIRYDDAFTAYLNGKKLVSAGYRNGRVKSHEADKLERFKLELRHLTLGRNVLAIKGENKDITSSDFSLHPALTDKPIINDTYNVDEGFLQCNIDYSLNRSSTYKKRKYKERFKYCYKQCYQGGVTKNTFDINTFIASSESVIKNNEKQYRFWDWRGEKINERVSKSNIETGFIRWQGVSHESCKATRWRAVVRLKDIEPTARSQQTWDIVNMVLSSGVKPYGGKMTVPGRERTDSIIFTYCAEEGSAVKSIAHSLNTLLDKNKKTQFLDKNLPAFLTQHKYIGIADYEGYPGHSHGAVLCHYVSSNLSAEPKMQSSLLKDRLKNIGYKGFKKISLPACYPRSKNELCQTCKKQSICPVLGVPCHKCQY